MKHAMWNRTVRAALSLGLCLSLAACASQAAGDNGAGSSEGPALEASELNGKGYSARHYDEDGQLKLPVVEDEVTYTVLLNKSPNDVGVTLEKEILIQAQEATGVKLNVEETPETGWNEKVSVVFASNQLPDMFMGGINSTSFINYVDQCVDVTDLLPVYAPYMSDYLFNRYPDVMKAEAIDGRLYSLPQARLNGIYSFEGWQINNAWLERVGMSVPTTLDELFDVLMAFKEQDANGNGDPSDEIPFSFIGVMNKNGLNSGLQHFLASFGLVNDGVLRADQMIMVEGGQVLFVPTHERYREMVEYLHKLYINDLLDPDGFIHEVADRNAKGQQDRYGVVLSGGELTEPVGGDVAKDFTYMVPPSGDYGVTLKQMLPPAELSLHTNTITRQAQNPENLLMFIEYCNSSFENRIKAFYGPEGHAWTYDENDMLEQVNDYADTPYANVQQARATAGTNYRLATLLNEEDEQRRLYTGFLGIYMEKGTTLYKPYVYDETFPQGSDTAEATAKRAEMFAEIDTYVQNFTAEAIMSGIDDAKWESHLENCRKLNIEEYVADFQDLYERLK